MDIIEIEVINWEKYNPRTDRKSSAWFRLENSIATEPKFYGLTASQKFIAICLFAEASKKCGAKAQVHIDWLGDQLKVSRDEIVETIAHLTAAGVVAVSSGVALVSSGCPTYGTNDTNERTNERECKLPQIWNEHCGPHLAQPQKISASRKRKVKLRVAEHTEAEWIEVVKRVAASRFCNGDNDRGWRASFDWLLRPDTAIKVLEGTYDNREQKPKTGDPWEAAARKVLDGIRTHPPGKTEELKAGLGDELFATALKVPGGIAAIRKMPANDFTIKTLSQMLAGSAT